MQILKRSIHLPEEFEGISECPDYPPRLSLQYSPTELEPANEHSNPKLRVSGLDRELNFNIKVLCKLLAIEVNSSLFLVMYIIDNESSVSTLPVNIPSSPMAIPHQLNMDDLPRIVPFLEHLNNNQLIALGCQLGLSYIGLKKMKTEDLLGEMVASWLREEYDVTPPSWLSLVAALEKIHQNGIARKIKTGKFE